MIYLFLTDKYFFKALYCDPPLSLCLVFDTFVLADCFTVFHGHLGLVGTHLFALPELYISRKQWLNATVAPLLRLVELWDYSKWIQSVCVCVCPSYLSWMSLSCRVCWSWTLERSFLRCSHCWVTWLSFISRSSLLWLLISSDHSLVCCAVMSFTCPHTDRQTTRLSIDCFPRTTISRRHISFWYLCFMICGESLDLIFCLLLQLLTVVLPVSKQHRSENESNLKPADSHSLSTSYVFT